MILWMKTAAKPGASSGHIAVSPDRMQLISTNMAESIDRYSISRSAWINDHDISKGVTGTQRSRLYGLAYLDSKTVITGFNGSHLGIISDTRQPEPNRFAISTFKLANAERRE